MRSFGLTLSVNAFFVAFILMCLVMETFLSVFFPIVPSFVVYAQPAASCRAERGQEAQQQTTPTGDPDTILERARGLVKTGNYGEALAALSPFISEPMEHPTIFSDYLVILLWDGQVDEAIRMYEALPPSFPQRAYLLRNMAKAYYDKRRFLKAVSLYQTAVKQAPADEEAQKGLVLCFIQTGDLDKAHDYLERFLERAPDSLSLALAKAHLLTRQGLRWLPFS